MPKVSVYIRNHQTREYEPADPKTAYPQGTIFCLRYKKDGKRKWETPQRHIRDRPQNVVQLGPVHRKNARRRARAAEANGSQTGSSQARQ